MVTTYNNIACTFLLEFMESHSWILNCYWILCC